MRELLDGVSWMCNEENWEKGDMFRLFMMSVMEMLLVTKEIRWDI